MRHRDDPSRSVARKWGGVRPLLGLLGLALWWGGCSSGGDSGSLTAESPSSAPSGGSAPAAGSSAASEQKATRNLVDLYRTAVVQEDSDRLQALLEGGGGAFAGGTFLEAMVTTFQRLAVTALQLSDVALEGARPVAVTFQEVLSVVDPAASEQRTRAGRTRWRRGDDYHLGVSTALPWRPRAPWWWWRASLLAAVSGGWYG